jgi:uncharacterized LabA/DUF88 family protein
MNLERLMIFIDGSNLYHSLKYIGKNQIDFQKFVEHLSNGRKIIEVFYYNAPLDISINSTTYWAQQKFFDKLRKIPKFNVVLCRLKKHSGKTGNIFEVKGDDIHLATDLISNAYENKYDTAIIVSGDEDFVPAIKKVQTLGKIVENAYFAKTSSNYLKASCNKSLKIDQNELDVIQQK